MKKSIKYFFAGLIFVSLHGNLFSQENDKKEVKRQSMTDRRKELANKKEEQRRKDEAAEEELKQLHIENQDKETQKRMKKSQKKAERNNSGKKGFSFRNWFAKKKRY